jgi:hypothetical protein
MQSAEILVVVQNAACRSKRLLSAPAAVAGTCGVRPRGVRSVRCGTAFGFDLKGLETLWQRSSARRVNLRRANRCDRARQAWG